MKTSIIVLGVFYKSEWIRQTEREKLFKSTFFVRPGITS
jgi:hypothetical protein